MLFLDWIPPSGLSPSGLSIEPVSSDSIRLSLALDVPTPLRGAYTISGSEPLQVHYDLENSRSVTLLPGQVLLITR